MAVAVHESQGIAAAAARPTELEARTIARVSSRLVPFLIV